MERRGDCRRQNWAELLDRKVFNRAANTGSAARLRYAANLCLSTPFIIAAPVLQPVVWEESLRGTRCLAQ